MKKQNNTFETITETAIYNRNSNAGRAKELIFKNEKNEKYQIRIVSESHESQSFAKLEKWTEIGYQEIVKKNPARDYNLHHDYQNYTQALFDGIIKDLQNIAKEF